MDTLTNQVESESVQLQIKRYYGSKYGNKTIYNEIKPSEAPIDINLNCKDRILENEIFSFDEYNKVEVTFFSSNPLDRLEIESYRGCNEEERYIDEFMKELKPGDTTLISPGGDIDDMLVPGSYEIRIKRDNIYYCGLYTINPSTATWNSLVNMRSYVEETVKGLSYNIYMERKGKSHFTYNINDTLMEKYRYLNEVKNILISSLDSIVKEPIISIEKVYNHSHKSKRPTNKSQRWMNKKGNKYNESIHRPDTFFEKRSIVSKDTSENRILKSMLEEIHNILVNLSIEFITVNKQLKKLLNELNSKIIHTEYRKQGADSNKNISYRVIKSIESDLNVLKNELSLYIDKGKQIQEYISNINRIKSNLNFYLRESWIVELDNSKNCIPTTKLIKNKYYHEVYRIYEYLRGSNIDGKEQKSFPYKKTSKLFEIYNFLLIKDVFEEFGFKWTSGWLKDKSDILTSNGDLQSNDYIILENGVYKVKVIYDKLLMRSPDLRGSSESQISAPQDIINTRPDILIEIYKEEEFLEAIIIEVKYRKLHYINHNSENTNVGDQLISYTRMDYHDGKLQRVNTRIRAISKVIALYPQQKHAKKIVHNTYSHIVFLPIMPSDNEKNVHNGYENLRNEMFETIQEYIDEELLVSTTI